jgi:hypothetical protein
MRNVHRYTGGTLGKCATGVPLGKWAKRQTCFM